ncbi:MAG: helicase-related protein [Betaproteobacteria bacterium]
MQISPPAPPSNPLPGPSGGDEVVVRQQRWRVQRIRAYGGCLVMSLAGIGAENLGAERQFLSPFDRVELARRPRVLRQVRAATWRRACRAALAAAVPPGALRAAADAVIDLLPHQLEPALAVVAGRGTRVLLADAVGLGKTIQAGLVIAELRARDAAERVLIVTPAGVRDQWRDELARRFQIEAVVVDAFDVRRRAAALPPDISPWATVTTAIASIDYVKRPETTPAVAECRWDVVVVDEAHGVGDATDRHGAIAALAGRAAYVLLLTATPHSGDRRAFLSLCRTGSHGEPLLVFRRARAAVRGAAARRIHRLHVRPTAAEARMHRLLEQFARAVRAEHGDGGRDVWLALAVLHKRALSSPRSLEVSVARRLSVLESGGDAREAQLALPLDSTGELDEADAAPWWPTPLALGDRQRERRLLDSLAAAAHAAAKHETKTAALVRLLRRVGEPVIVFTEYRDTLLHLARRLPGPAAIVHGGLSRRERQSALDDFTAGRRRWLVATDAAGQGLNLHARCRTIVNLELPWNPVRLEQRIGRVDRIGQTRTVHAFHLVGRGTAEEAILDRLRTRVAAAHIDIGTTDPVGMEDEVMLARQVIGGLPSATVAVARSPADSAPRMSLDLSFEAQREAARLAAVRNTVGVRERRLLQLLEVESPWFARAGSRRTRQEIASRVILLIRSVLEDPAGRVVADRMTPVAIGCGHAATRPMRRDIEILWRLARQEVVERVNAATRTWHAETARMAQAFAQARLARLQAILAVLDQPNGLFQPGLFDRRAIAERSTVEALAALLREDIAARLDEARLRAAVRLREPELWLVVAR